LIKTSFVHVFDKSYTRSAGLSRRFDLGTNVLGGTSKDSILKAYRESIKEKGKEHNVPPKWDGQAAERVWRVIGGFRN
jgi:UDP-N-acetylglucosamine 2-epimerase